MIKIATDQLPTSCLTYLAFRISFQETLERIALANQIGDAFRDGFGYLTEVPFLRSVPPHVQLDLLAEVWSKHCSAETFEASLVDESVVYAACETAARIVDNEPRAAQRFIKDGPLDILLAVDGMLASELRSLHLKLSNEGDFLMISQFEDMQPEEARQFKQKFDLDEARLETMFDVLGRYNVSENVAQNLDGLLSTSEVSQAISDMQVEQPAS